MSNRPIVFRVLEILRATANPANGTKVISELPVKSLGCNGLACYSGALINCSPDKTVGARLAEQDYQQEDVGFFKDKMGILPSELIF